MYALGSQLSKNSVISLQTGQAVATTGGLIINPDNLELVAMHCRAERSKNLVIMMRDVRQVAKDCLVIDSEDEIEDAAEIVRLQQMLESKFQLIGLPVVTESGHKLGKVEDYTINLSSYRVQKLYVKQPIMKNLLLNHLVVDREQIIDVNPKQITVRDATLTDPLLAAKPLPIK